MSIGKGVNSLEHNLKIAVDKFVQYRQQLYSEFPHTEIDAVELGKNIVDANVASAEQIWDVLWPKPLYANAKSDSADKKVDALRDSLQGAWKSMAIEGGPFEIDRPGRGFAKKSFDIIGPSAQQIVREFRIAPHRLCAISGAAKNLSTRAEKSDTPFADLISSDLPVLLPVLKENFGFGWGPATILHFLTDLGLACKPDRQLVRTIKALGIWEKTREQVNFREAIKVNQIVHVLAEEIYEEVTPEKFRVLDKNLMDISKYLFKPRFVPAVGCSPP